MVSVHPTPGHPTPLRGSKRERRSQKQGKNTRTSRVEWFRSRSPLSPFSPRKSPPAESVHTVGLRLRSRPDEAPAVPCPDRCDVADRNECLRPVLLLRSDEWATRHTTPGRRQEIGSMATTPLWMLMPWVVFAVAAGVKFWRLTSAWRQRGTTNKSTDQFRRSLERIWANKGS